MRGALDDRGTAGSSASSRLTCVSSGRCVRSPGCPSERSSGTAAICLSAMTFDHRARCCEALGISVEGVSTNAVRDEERRAHAAYVELIERTFWLMRAYGFSRIVAV